MCSKGRGLWLKTKMYLSHPFRKTALIIPQHVLNSIHYQLSLFRNTTINTILYLTWKTESVFLLQIFGFLFAGDHFPKIYMSVYNLTKRKLEVPLSFSAMIFFTNCSEISNYVANYVKLLWSPLFRFAKMVLGSVLLGSPRRNIRPKRR